MRKSDNSSLRLLNVCRVSSNEQSEGYSLVVQSQTNAEWAKRKGYTIVDTEQYVETASKQKERKRFREIIDRICRDPLIDGVVFHKVDPACRNMTDLAMLEKIEIEKNKRVFFSTQEFPQNAAGRLSAGVMGVVSRWYTDNLKEEVNKGFKGKIEAGEYPHKPPYGYCRAKGSKLVTPDAKKANIAKMIYQLMATGDHSLDSLREELYQKGMYFSKTAKKWTRSYIGKVLRNPFYVGKMRWRGKVYPGKHKPIIDEGTWNKVQSIFEGRRNSSNSQKRKFTYGHGLMKCSGCGNKITAEIHKGRYTYYVCSQRRNIDHSFELQWVKEKEIESQIIALLQKLVLPAELYDWVIQYLRVSAKKTKQEKEKEIASLKRRLKESQVKFDNLLIKASESDNKFSDGFMRLAGKQQTEISLLQSRLEGFEMEKKEDIQKPLQIIELTQDIANKYVSFKSVQKREIVESVFSNLSLNGVSLCADYNLPFEILAKNAEHPLNYAREDSNLWPSV